ncbi:MAG: hypothetical protein K8R02_03270 [Anaerohalosphaeraceae bacterium]|nr:hypothetical protein [Anaerohalosphaeraceae bacterium]
MAQVQVIPDINNPLPELYISPPAIKIFSPDDTKLYYFVRNNTTSALSGLITSQLGYAVSTNDATNQIIVKCKTAQNAQNTLDFLDKVDVPPIQVRIDCLISEMFADATLDWETSLDITKLFGIGTSTTANVGDTVMKGITMLGGGSNKQAFLGASNRAPARGDQGLQIGYAPSSNFGAFIDMLDSRGYLKIVMNPTLRTLNGKRANITTIDNVPIIEFVKITEDGKSVEVTKYKQVIDSLEVTPFVYADGSIGLTTKVTIGSKSTPEGATQNTIITSRTIEMQENRIMPGDSLIVGGIRKSESLGITRGVPFLEDLPLLGVLFSSKDREDRVKEILFILTPSISSPGVNYETMRTRIQQKHAKPEYKQGFVESIIDPFDTSEYTQHIERKAAESEAARVTAEQRTTQARYESAKISAMAQTEMAAAEKVKAEADKEKAQAEIIKAKAEKTQAEAEIAKAQAKKAQAQAEKAKKEAAKAKAEAEKARKEAEIEKAKVAN